MYARSAMESIEKPERLSFTGGLVGEVPGVAQADSEARRFSICTGVS